MVIVRLPILLGPGDHRGRSTSLVARLAAGRQSFVMKGGIAFTDVRDVAQGLATIVAIPSPRRIYHLAGTSCSLIDFFRQAADLAGVAPPRLCLPKTVVIPFAHLAHRIARIFGTKSPLPSPVVVEMGSHYWGFTSRWSHELGYRPRLAQETLRDTIAWCEDQKLPMDPNETAIVSRRHATDHWEQQILRNVEVLEGLGISRDRAEHLVNEFIRIVQQFPPPSVLQVFDDPSAPMPSELLTEAKSDGRAFMLEFLAPIMACVSVDGRHQLDRLAPLLGRIPITVVSNHLSHLDAPAIFWALWHASPTGRSLAERLVVLAGRFASQAKFARPALSLFSSLLVCSPTDMGENPGLHELMGRINRHAFRQARRLQGTGESWPSFRRVRVPWMAGQDDSSHHFTPTSQTP
jgi:hypothetical protein